MEIEFDPAKRLLTLQDWGLDFPDAPRLIAGRILAVVDDRSDYNELRFVSYGFIADVAVAVVWTDRDGVMRIISMRKCMWRRYIMSDWIDPDDAPLLTAEIAARAEIREGGKVIRPATETLTRMGRPPLGKSVKKQVTLRLDSEVVEAFRAGGAGWQSRMNEVLRKAVQHNS